ncbi:MAG: accessory factor UbiK family protein [Gammaproteobacteria bacterium]|nr:MAG: accessory factor UbiK family protein [Gammaproteobacteria bacterium]
MIDFKVLDVVAGKLSSLLPAEADAFRKEIESQFRTVLNKVFEELDLVTREEFDIQTEVLRRTREKLERLEKTIASIEQSRLNKD